MSRLSASRSASLALPLFWLVLLGGCAGGYTAKTDSFILPLAAGRYDQAAAAVNAAVGPVADDKGTDPTELMKTDKSDRLIFRLEQGAVLRTAGKFEESALALRHADQLIQDADERAKTRVSQEVKAALTNQAFREYEAFPYDRTSLQINLALNYMHLGRWDDARTALRAFQQRQQEAEEYYQRRIDAAEREAGNPSGKAGPSGSDPANPNGPAEPQPEVDSDKVRSDPKVAGQFQQAYGEDVVTVPNRDAYRNFTHAFGDYLSGIYFMGAGQDPSDFETAAVAFKRVAGQIDTTQNPYLAQDIAAAEAVASGARPSPTTYVLFETGLAPSREQIRIDLPIFLVNIAVTDTGVDYVGAAFPRLVYHDGYIAYLNVLAGGQNYRTALVTDSDQMIKTAFRNELPLIITRTIISTVAKAAAAYGLNKATEQNVYLNIATRISTTVYQAAMNDADLRTWRSLPKQYQVARFPTPADRTLTLAQPDGSSFAPIALPQGNINVVVVRSPQAGSVPAVQQFVLP